MAESPSSSVCRLSWVAPPERMRVRKRLIYAAVGVVGVLLIGLAIASATAWSEDDVLRA